MDGQVVIPRYLTMHQELMSDLKQAGDKHLFAMFRLLFGNLHQVMEHFLKTVGPALQLDSVPFHQNIMSSVLIVSIGPCLGIKHGQVHLYVRAIFYSQQTSWVSHA